MDRMNDLIPIADCAACQLKRGSRTSYGPQRMADHYLPYATTITPQHAALIQTVLRECIICHMICRSSPPNAPQPLLTFLHGMSESFNSLDRNQLMFHGQCTKSTTSM